MIRIKIPAYCPNHGGGGGAWATDHWCQQVFDNDHGKNSKTQNWGRGCNPENSKKPVPILKFAVVALGFFRFFSGFFRSELEQFRSENHVTS